MAKLALVKSSPIQKIVDELGEVTEQRKHFEVREKALKEVLKKHGPGSLLGKEYVAMLFERHTTFYKSELLREHVDAAILKKCEIITPYLKVEVQKKSQLRVV